MVSSRQSRSGSYQDRSDWRRHAHWRHVLDRRVADRRCQPHRCRAVGQWLRATPPEQRRVCDGVGRHLCVGSARADHAAAHTDLHILWMFKLRWLSNAPTWLARRLRRASSISARLGSRPPVARRPSHVFNLDLELREEFLAIDSIQRHRLRSRLPPARALHLYTSNLGPGSSARGFPERGARSLWLDQHHFFINSREGPPRRAGVEDAHGETTVA